MIFSTNSKVSKLISPSFTVTFTKNAQKQYNKLPNVIKPRVARTIASLSQNPFNGKKLGGELSGLRVLRAWPYRIIYQASVEGQKVEISNILHRQGAYK